MEKKASYLRNKIAKLFSLSHGTSSIPTFLTSPPRSPRKPASTKPFSTSIIPSGARRRPKNGTSGFDTGEPTSPKVSCSGRIINKNKAKPKQKPKPKTLCRSTSTCEVKAVKTRHKKCAKENIDDGPKDDANDDSNDKIVVPSVGEMKRFTSGRVVLKIQTR